MDAVAVSVSGESWAWAATTESELMMEIFQLVIALPDWMSSWSDGLLESRSLSITWEVPLNRSPMVIWSA